MKCSRFAFRFMSDIEQRLDEKHAELCRVLASGQRLGINWVRPKPAPTPESPLVVARTLLLGPDGKRL